jgi:hypothetical protein
MRSGFFKIRIIIFFLLIQNQWLIAGNSQFEPVRYYVAKENVAICEDGFMVLEGGSPILVNSLFHDDSGFYFLEAGSGWVCNWCREVNPLEADVCQACGKPYGSSPPKKK